MTGTVQRKEEEKTLFHGIGRSDVLVRYLTKQSAGRCCQTPLKFATCQGSALSCR